MNELRYTLVSDGSSDEALLPLLTWLLRQNGISSAIQATWADLRRLRQPPQKLADKITRSVDLYPSDLLFIHRDAENESHEYRTAEIKNAIAEARRVLAVLPMICVVPVRMQEAWLLCNEKAIRRAAGNPLGHQALQIPALSRLEQLPDPKNILHELLREASGLKGRRRKRIPTNKQARRVAEFIEDFSVLRALAAFKALETDVQKIVEQQKWNL